MYENDWIRVEHHEVLGPTGGPGVYGTVHFKNQATGVVPIDNGGNVILVGQYRFPLHAYSWEIPEGRRSARDRTALESAQRELREECGLEARHWLQLLDMDLSNSVSDERSTVFLAWELSEDSFAAGRNGSAAGRAGALLGCGRAREARRDPRRDERRGSPPGCIDGVAGTNLPEQIARAIGRPGNRLDAERSLTPVRRVAEGRCVPIGSHAEGHIFSLDAARANGLEPFPQAFRIHARGRADGLEILLVFKQGIARLCG